MDYFSGWTEQDQIEFVEELLVFIATARVRVIKVKEDETV